jgi:nuclear transport factor 2 (NTF2) superfamily protein
MPNEYTPPKTLEEASKRIVELQNEVHEICSQLSDKDKRDARGVRVSYRDYHDWRKRAIYAMESRKRELRLTKLWQKNENIRLQEEANSRVFDDNDPGDLLFDAYNLIKEIFRSYGSDDIKPSEQERLDKYRDWLRGAGYRA